MPQGKITRDDLRKLSRAKIEAQHRLNAVRAKDTSTYDEDELIDHEIDVANASRAYGQADIALSNAAAEFDAQNTQQAVLNGDQPSDDAALLHDIANHSGEAPEPYCEMTGPLDTPGSGYYIGRAAGDGGRSIERYLATHNGAGTTDGC